MCQTCHKGFNHFSNLYQQQLIDNDERSFVCEICRKQFKQASGLNHHQHIHNAERSFVCKTCNMRFKQYSCLYTHRRYHCTQRCKQTELQRVKINNSRFGGMLLLLSEILSKFDYNLLLGEWMILKLYFHLNGVNILILNQIIIKIT